jgi:hypothetical protein
MLDINLRRARLAIVSVPKQAKYNKHVQADVRDSETLKRSSAVLTCMLW